MKLITNLVLIPVEGIYENGAAIGSVLCHIVSFTIVYNVLKRTVKLNFCISELMVKPLVVTVLMSAISYLCYNLVLKLGIVSIIATVVGILIAIVVYFVLVILFKILSREDIYSLPKGEKIYSILQKMKIYL